VLVLDEADRMIADGHFKEMRDILAHIYTRRLKIKTSKIGKPQMPNSISDENIDIVEIGEMKEAAFDNTNFFIGKNLEAKGDGGIIDVSNAQDLFDDDALFEEIKREGNIVIETKKEKTEGKKEKTKSQKELKKLEDANFVKEYQKAGGIQHIICSATMTIDKQGRITPRIAKAEKKQKLRAKT
jgi:glycerophosphoryl diester phosphodiesterase